MRLFIFVLLVIAILSYVSAQDTLDLSEHGRLSQSYFDQRKAELSLDDKLGVSGVRGIDFANAYSVDTLTCLKKNGFVFAIARGYQSFGRVDPNMRSNVRNSHTVGFKNVDIYMFPCPHCGNPSGQVQAVKNSIVDVKVGMVWVDVEGPQYWMGQQANKAFLQSVLHSLSTAKIHTGIYTSKYMWNTLFGSNFNAGSHYPLWYAHYDNKPDFSDFSAFGGWTKPSIKQYQGDVMVCGADVDYNVY